MIELVATWGGVFLRPSYARNLAILLKSKGVSLIVDECFTACRCGYLLLSRSDAYRLTPDAISLGKWGFGMLLVSEDSDCIVNPQHCCDHTINGRPAVPRQASGVHGVVFELVFRDVHVMRVTGVMDTASHGEWLPPGKLLDCVKTQSMAWATKILADMGPPRVPGEPSLQIWGVGLLFFVSGYVHLRVRNAQEGEVVVQESTALALEKKALISDSYRAAVATTLPVETPPYGDGLSGIQKPYVAINRAGRSTLPVLLSGLRTCHQWAQGHNPQHPSYMPASFRVSPVVINGAHWEAILAQFKGGVNGGARLELQHTLPAILRPDAPIIFDPQAPWDKECSEKDHVLPALAQLRLLGRRKRASSLANVVGRTPLCTLAGVWQGIELVRKMVISFHKADAIWSSAPTVSRTLARRKAVVLRELQGAAPPGGAGGV